jgi:hypothetical protein
MYLPNGLICSLYKAISAKEDDVGALNTSNLNVNMMHLQPEVSGMQYNGKNVLHYSVNLEAIFRLYIKMVSLAIIDHL